jgi:hypothetical protein
VACLTQCGLDYGSNLQPITAPHLGSQAGMRENINGTRYKRKKTARCADCGKALVGRRGLCDHCRKKLRDYVKNLHGQRGSEGLCPLCGGVKPATLKCCLACIFETDKCPMCKRSMKSSPGDHCDHRVGLQDVPSLLALLQSARTEVIPDYLRKCVSDLSGFENATNQGVSPYPIINREVTRPHRSSSPRKPRRRRQ